MTIELLFYLSELLSTLKLIGGVSFIFICGIIILLCGWIKESKEEAEIDENKKIIRFFIPFTILSFLMMIFLPTMETTNKMIIAHYLKESELPEKTLNLIDKYLNKGE